MKNDTKTITRIQHTLIINKSDLLYWLRRRTMRPVPKTATMTVTVPTGDYNGDTHDLDEIGGLTVQWEEETIIVEPPEV